MWKKRSGFVFIIDEALEDLDIGTDPFFSADAERKARKLRKLLKH